MKTIMLSTAFLASICCRPNEARADHFNFRGANIYRIKGGLFQVCGHHQGEAEETIAWLRDKMSKVAA